MQTNQHLSRINDILCYIHKDISQELLASDLASRAAYSEQHFHRIFRKIVGESVHQYIRRTRLEFAANQLMFEVNTSVQDIAIKSGFISVSSFSRAFKSVYNMSPGEWRNFDINSKLKPYLSDSEIASHYIRLRSFELPQVDLVDLPERYVAYVRHQGYNRTIKTAWQHLLAWAKAEDRDSSQQYGLHHSNPACVELSQCRYVACISIDSPIQRRGVVNSFTIPGGLHAVFKLKGVYGELLPQISHILDDWLPSSGFKMQSTPAYVNYQKNHYLDKDEQFELEFCLPISFYN